jgi:hypothetical protein
MVSAMLALGLGAGQKAAGPPVRLSAYQFPVVGGQREIILGPSLHEDEYDGFFVQKPKTYAHGGGLPPTMIDFEEVRVGWMDWSVTSYPFEGKPALLLQTEGTYNQVYSDRFYGDIPLRNREKRGYWLTPAGKVLQENSLITLKSGTWSMQASYKTDCYDLYLNDPIKGERRKTVYPACGMSKLNSMFTPMMKEDKVLLQEKEFYDLDPVYGAPIKYVAKYGGHFEARWFGNTPYSGLWFTIDGGGIHQKAYITYSGVLLRVEEPNNHYLNIETRPDASPYPKKSVGKSR